jgi:hypothetical protein
MWAMTQMPPYRSEPPTMPPFMPPPPPRRKRMGTLTKVLLILVGVAMVVLCIGLIGALVDTTIKQPASNPVVGGKTLGGPEAAKTTAAPPPAKSYATPTAKDFTIKAKVTQKQCFGSAGCNIQFTVDLNYTGTPAEPSSSWDVTYDAKGTEDPFTATIRLVFDADGVNGTYSNDEQFVQTKSSKTVVTPVITSITKA